MNTLLSYCGLVDAKIRASDKDLPVLCNCIGNCNMNLIAYLKYETANHTNCLEQVGIQMKIFPIFEHVKEMLNKSKLCQKKF